MPISPRLEGLPRHIAARLAGLRRPSGRKHRSEPSRDPSGARPEANGFTLVEMLAVLTILGVVAALFAARMQRDPGSLQRARAALTLENAIAGAAQDARSSGKAVAFDPAAYVAEASVGAPAFPAPQGQLLLHPDGSTSGGVIELAGEPLLKVDWLTGGVARAE